MAYPDARIYVFDQTGAHPTPYTETEHYILTRRFLGDHTSILRELFEEEGDLFPGA
jgi:predicted ATPase